MLCRRVEIAGGTALQAVVLGAERPGAPVVVLVHGMVVASNGMLPLARALAGTGLVVHLPDLPGFGRSDKPRHALDVDRLAAAASGYVDALGLAGAAVLGNSFGTQVAGALAASSPGRVGRLVLLSPTIDDRFRGRWTEFLPRGAAAGPPTGPPAHGRSRRLAGAVRHRLVPEPGAGDPSLRSLIVREYAAAGPVRALSTYRHALRDDLAARMPLIDAPTLVVRAGDDRTVSPAWARRLASAASRGSFLEIPGIDHDAQFHRPGPVARAVAGFLAGGPAPGAPASGEGGPLSPPTPVA